MKTLLRALVLLAALAGILAVVQRTEIVAARKELAGAGTPALSTALAPAAQMAAAPGDAGEGARLRAENRDIHKVRSLISEAREKRRALERLEKENAQLREKIAHIKAQPEGEKTVLPFSNQGQSTPRAAVETSFWSMHQGDMETLARIMPMAAAEFERMPENERTNMFRMLRAMAATVESIEVLEENAEAGEARVRTTHRFDASLGAPEQSTLVLRLTNGNWMITGQR